MNSYSAIKYRPKKLDEYVGQKHLLSPSGVIFKMIHQQRLFSMIFYGPSGCGKTSLAELIALEMNLSFRHYNAAIDNKKKLDDLFIEAKLSDGLVIIIDEIHRLNKDKQDLLLPYLENGLITIIGATTSNPYFAINPAIRSRVMLFELFALSEEEIVFALKNVLNKQENSFSYDLDALEAIARQVNGDLRYALNILDIACLQSKNKHLEKSLIKQLNTLNNHHSFKDDDGYYDLLSAFQKSIRGSDCNAGLYYLALLLKTGDYETLKRRLTVIAYEDIGLANPALCARVVTALEACAYLGYPENQIPLSNVVIELCLSPKSKSATYAIHKATDLINQQACQMPKYLKLTPLNIDEKDKYPYDKSHLWHRIQYLPDKIKNIEFYTPLNNNHENILKDNYEKLKKIKRYNKISELAD